MAMSTIWSSTVAHRETATKHESTVETVVQASAAGLDVANNVLRAVAFKMSVPLQWRQSSPAWKGKREALQVRPDNLSPMADPFDVCERVASLQGFHNSHERRFVLAADHGVREREGARWGTRCSWLQRVISPGAGGCKQFE